MPVIKIWQVTTLSEYSKGTHAEPGNWRGRNAACAHSGTAGTETLTGQTDVPSDGTTTTAAIRDVTSLLGQPVKPRTATTRSAATGTAQ